MRFTSLIPIISFLFASSAGALDSDREARLQWFDEARFGMFIHWGVYAVPAGEWQGKQVPGIGEWILRNAKIPVADYKSFAAQFTAASYDPASWAKLAKEAGMKYIVITSKHHDGFALYDSAVSDWDVMQSGAKRDLIEPLAKATRQEGLKFGLYYSHSQDWMHPGGAINGQQIWDPSQAGSFDSYLQTISLPQVKEIVARYQPDLIWWDTPEAMTLENFKPFADFLDKHPNIINNGRLGRGVKADYRSAEQYIPAKGYPGKRLEVCMTMNDSWGFKKNDHNWKPTRQIIRNLSDASSKGANFLLNVGPKADGTIPQESIERLQAVGRWMSVNQEAIHATQASPFPRRLPWGCVTQKKSETGTTLYLHVWEWPKDKEVLLPTLQGTFSRGTLLADRKALTTSVSKDGLIVHLPDHAPDADVSVIKLEFSGNIKVTMSPFNEPDELGKVTLSVLDANPHGRYQVRNPGPDAYLTGWKNPDWKLSYEFITHKAQEWVVAAEVATPAPAKLTLSAKNQSIPVTIEATGPELTWKTVTLGEIALPEGETSFELVGVKEDWKGISLRNIWLTPKE